MTFPALVVLPKTGSEPFHEAGTPLGPTALSFWSWACSDMNGNALRGLVAEYLVATATGAPAPTRVEWDQFDVETPEGVRVEVKTSAYLQSWEQKALSKIGFDIAPKRGWDARTNTMAGSATRSAHVYVFALHAHQDKATVDPMNVAQWTFYVLPTSTLNAKMPLQQTLSLGSLLALAPTRASFSELRAAILERACS